MQSVSNYKTENFDCPSWIASPCGKRKSSFPEYRFTWIDIFIIIFSMATFLADIVTDVLVMLVYWKNDELAWAALTLTFFIVPAIILQVFSARWFIADGHKLTWSMMFIHLLMMGPIKRYISVLQHGFKARKTKRIEDYQLMYSELSDVSMLRLFECFLESAPQLVLQLNIIIRVEENDYILTGISACFSLLSLSWAIVAYTRALRAAANSRHRVSLAGSAVHGLWRGGMLLSRLTAILMFATVFQEWTLLLLGLHWLLMTAWIIYQDTDFCNTWLEERIFNLIIGIIYVFCFFNMKEGKSRYRLAFYYAIVLVENSVMILLWWPRRMEGKWYNIPALSSVWGGFALGMLCMVLYYLYFHPASKHRCHCCMAWRKLTFLCHTYCCHSQDKPIASPYKQVDDGRQFFDSTDSSHEMLDYRDFTELRSSYDVHSNIAPTITTKPVNEKQQEVDEIHECTSLQLSTHDRLDSSDETEKVSEVVVVGNAQMGFRVKQLKPQNSMSDPAAAPAPSKYIAMPLPNATSTPADDLKPECNKNILALQVSTPSKILKPGSPNTLVKNWVKKTQEMYESKDPCFSKISRVNKIQVTDSMNRYENTQRRYPLKMKSFSKKERLGHKPSVLRRDKKKRRGSARNSFREAFGFHVIDLDNLSDTLSNADKVTQTCGKNVTSTMDANVIRSRIDKPPSPEPQSLGLKKKLTQFQQKIDEECSESVVSEMGPILPRKMPSTPVTSACGKNSDESENYCETSSNKDMREVEIPFGVGRKKETLNRNEANRHSARKKLNFKEASSCRFVEPQQVRDEKEGILTSTKSQKTTSRRILGAIENQC